MKEIIKYPHPLLETKCEQVTLPLSKEDEKILDDRETANALDHLFNSTMFYGGTYKEICDFLRTKGYEVISLSNATKEEIKQCEKECLNAWKVWKQNEKVK